MNVLISSAGRRVSLLRAFQRDAADVRPGTEIIACDSRPDLSSACEVAGHSFSVPPVTAPNYFDVLVEGCRRFDVHLVVPTIDPELAVLAARRQDLADLGITAVICDLPLINQTTDKGRSSEMFAALGLQTPRAMSKDELTYPLFVKPREGSSSVGVIAADSSDDIPPAYFENSDYLFQELIPKSDYEEFTVDIYYDRTGNLRCLVPRLRMETRGGEVSKGLTVRDRLYDYLLLQLAEMPGARGCVTLQVFADSSREKVLAIEVNPRFGGGYPLSYAAGARYPGWIIREYLGDEPIEFFDDWESDLLMLRYDDAVFRNVSED